VGHSEGGIGWDNVGGELSMDDGALFIRDLAESLRGVAVRPDPPLTTLACGEEGDVTSLMIGEEGGC